MNRLAYIPRNGRIRSDRLSRRPVTPKPSVGGSLRGRHGRGLDSLRLSLVRLERQRALNLLLTILCFLVMAACVYLAQV